MAGYGNKTSMDPNPTDLTDDHKNTRLGLNHSNAYSGGDETYGSGATGGAGFGNKTNISDESEDYDNSEFRFGSHANTDPYSGAKEHKSGSVGGAGYGNKTGSFKESHGE